MNPLFRHLLVSLLALLALVITVSVLSGCGGGGDLDDADVPTPGVDCNLRPELCT